MELTLHVEEEGSGRADTHTVAVEPGDPVRNALETAGISPETVLVERDGTVIPLTAEVRADDTALRVLDVISGG